MKDSAGGTTAHPIHEALVNELTGRMPPELEICELADFFKVLGDSTRSRIISALVLSELCVCDLAALLGMSKSAISHQLRALKQAQLVKCRRDGKIVYYSLADWHVKEIFKTALTHLEEHLEEQ